MNIRTRLTLWYAAILLGSVLLIGGMSYHEFMKGNPSAAMLMKPADEDAEDDIRAVARVLLYYGVPTALLGLLGGWWLTRKALEPVSALTHAFEQIHDRNLRTQLPRSNNGDELDRLTEVFNAMTVRLDDSFQRIREFTLHASHELKTPLTVMHGEMETALLASNISAVEQERLASQLDEVQRLAKIVDGLTLLTKADAGQIQLESRPVRLDELVGDMFADAQILAYPYQLKILLTPCPKLTIKGDRHRLRQLLLNLVDNAIKYNRPGGSVGIELVQQEAWAELRITNTGPGIPAALLPRLGERFLRGDASHNNEIEGCGLGLSIVQWIVHAHGGSLRFASEPDAQTTVTVRLPVFPDKQE